MVWATDQVPRLGPRKEEASSWGLLSNRAVSLPGPAVRYRRLRIAEARLLYLCAAIREHQEGSFSHGRASLVFDKIISVSCLCITPFCFHAIIWKRLPSYFLVPVQVGSPRIDIFASVALHGKMPLSLSFVCNAVRDPRAFRSTERFRTGEIGCLVLILQQIKQNHSTLTFLLEIQKPQKKSSTIRSITDQTKRPNPSSASREANTEQNIH
jgi:hypothetical protein